MTKEAVVTFLNKCPGLLHLVTVTYTNTTPSGIYSKKLLRAGSSAHPELPLSERGPGMTQQPHGPAKRQSISKPWKRQGAAT